MTDYKKRIEDSLAEVNRVLSFWKTQRDKRDNQDAYKAITDSFTSKKVLLESLLNDSYWIADSRFEDTTNG